MSKKILPKIIVVIGSTSSGKSDLAVNIAKKYNGEIISADSRQVYKYLDIGSGNITEKEMEGIKHHCLDIVDPVLYSKKYLKDKSSFSVQEYLKHANLAIKDILSRGKVPILCGGTGLYIDAIIYGLPKNAKINSNLRLELEKENLTNLLNRIKKINKEKYLELKNNKNTSEVNNKRRLIRIIEILESKKNSGKEIIIQKLNKESKYNVEFIFSERPKEELVDRIKLRLKKRLSALRKNNLINEVKFLRDELKINDTWLLSLGLEYKFVTLYLQNNLTLEEMITEIENKSWQYAKRQMTWNKRYKNDILEK